MHGTIPAVLDACVLNPALLRNILLQLATPELFRARWSETIHDEWSRSLLADKPDIALEAIARLRRLMNEAVPDGLVTGHEALTEKLSLPDPSDRHVLAAAIRARASVIVTLNTRDFPPAALRSHGIEAQHPDIFVTRLLDRSPAIVIEAMQTVRGRLKNPPLDVEVFLERTRMQGLRDTATALAPQGNYQHALRDAVAERIRMRESILVSLASTEAGSTIPATLDALDRIPVLPSRPNDDAPRIGDPRPPVDFASREQSNRSLGLAGERWTMDFERLRLAQLGRPDLAEGVRHVSQEDGDGLGFDILSFDHSSSRERLIEVKTTRASIYTPFYLTRNEVEVSRRRSEDFHLYRVHSYGARTRVYILSGAMNERCDLDPTVYRARPRPTAS